MEEFLMSRKFKLSALILSLLIALFALVPSVIVSADEDETDAPVELSTLSATRVLSLTVGDVSNISSQLPEGFGGGVQYSSDDPAVATVSAGGTVTAKKAGQATIRAYNSTHVQFFDYTVKEKATTAPTTAKPSTTLKTLTVIGTLRLNVEKGKTVTLSHAGLDGSITFRSGNAQIATVSTSGVVTGVKVGTTYIQAFNKTHVQNYEFTVTETEKETEKETVTVEETTTEAAETETVTIAEIVDIENDSTYPDISSSATVEPSSSDNSGLRTRILIITAAVILVIIIAAIIIYKLLTSKNNDDYPMDFYPEDNFEANPNDELPEYNFNDVDEDDGKTVDASGEEFDSSFINENPDESSDDTFLL